VTDLSGSTKAQVAQARWLRVIAVVLLLWAVLQIVLGLLYPVTVGVCS
jgi:hypothetical protein